MIRLACTNCKTVLSIDDAFAGGVCRCQHCGTIQTVPASARDGSGASVSGQSMGGSRVVVPTDAPASGLDDLAGIVVSSGLASRRLKTAAAGPGPSAPKSKSSLPLFVILGLVIAGLVGVIVWLAMRPATGNSSTAAGTAPPTSAAPTIAPNKPGFAGLSLDVPTVVYLLDRGSGTKEMFGTLKDAALKSAASLGSDRKFAIVFWNNGSAAAYPDGSTTFATHDNLEAARKAIDDISAFGASDAVPGLQQAITLNPDVIVIATAKGWDLDDSWVGEMMTARGTSTTKIDAVSLGSAGSGNALKALASKTGGEFEEVSETELRNYVDQ